MPAVGASHDFSTLSPSTLIPWFEADLLGREPGTGGTLRPAFEGRVPAAFSRPSRTARGRLWDVVPRGSSPPGGLLQAGFAPTVIERGPDVTERTKRWNRFLHGDAFDPESNLLFGEGGAGAYSDGKLYTRVRDPRVREVLEVLAASGAPQSILYDAKPHIGSNLLPSVVRRLSPTAR